MKSSLGQEIAFVADTIHHAHALEKLLEEKVTAAIKKEIRILVAAISGGILVADFALTGDEDAVLQTVEDIRDRGLHALVGR